MEYSRLLVAWLLNTQLISWHREHFRDPVADRRRAAGLARVPHRQPDHVQRGRRAAAAGRRDPARLLREPGAAVRDSGTRAADEPARRGLDIQQEPPVARRRAAGG